MCRLVREKLEEEVAMVDSAHNFLRARAFGDATSFSDLRRRLNDLTCSALISPRV